MRETRRKATALLAGLQLIAAVALAQSPEVERLIPAQPVGLVNDFASLLDPATRAELEDLLTRLRSATGAEVTVVTLPTIGDHDEGEVATAAGVRAVPASLVHRNAIANFGGSGFKLACWLPITQPALSTTAATASARLTVARAPLYSSAAA